MERQVKNIGSEGYIRVLMLDYPKCYIEAVRKLSLNYETKYPLYSDDVAKFVWVDLSELLKRLCGI